jgi:hypothetical protein
MNTVRCWHGKYHRSACGTRFDRRLGTASCISAFVLMYDWGSQNSFPKIPLQRYGGRTLTGLGSLWLLDLLDSAACHLQAACPDSCRSRARLKLEASCLDTRQLSFHIRNTIDSRRQYRALCFCRQLQYRRAAQESIQVRTTS